MIRAVSTRHRMGTSSIPSALTPSEVLSAEPLRRFNVPLQPFRLQRSSPSESGTPSLAPRASADDRAFSFQRAAGTGALRPRAWRRVRQACAAPTEDRGSATSTPPLRPHQGNPGRCAYRKDDQSPVVQAFVGVVRQYAAEHGVKRQRQTTQSLAPLSVCRLVTGEV